MTAPNAVEKAYTRRSRSSDAHWLGSGSAAGNDAGTLGMDTSSSELLLAYTAGTRGAPPWYWTLLAV